MAHSPDLSVLIPFYNEEGNVGPVLEEVVSRLDGLAFEVICVDDASTDGTAGALVEAKARWGDRVVVLTHRARRGKSAAVFSGLKVAAGTWVQLLDGDGQNDPADARRLWDAVIAPGAPAALGLIGGRRARRKDGAFKWLQSRIANGVRRFALRDGSTDTGCGFKLIRTEAFRDVPYFAAAHRFLPALVKRAGWEVREEPVADRKRLSGRSKYGLFGRLGAGIVDLLGVMWLIRRGAAGEVVERR